MKLGHSKSKNYLCYEINALYWIIRSKFTCIFPLWVSFASWNLLFRRWDCKGVRLAWTKSVTNNATTVYFPQCYLIPIIIPRQIFPVVFRQASHREPPICCHQTWKEENLVRNITFVLALHCRKLFKDWPLARQEEGCTVKYTPLLEGVPEGEDQGSSLRRRGLFDRISRSES